MNIIKCCICQKQHYFNNYLKCNDFFTNIIDNFLKININQYIDELKEIKIINNIKKVKKYTYKCEKCNKILSSSTNYKKHIKNEICARQHEYKCEKCNKILINKQTLKYHIKHNVCKKIIPSKRLRDSLINNSTNIQTQNNDNSITTNIQTLNNQQNNININISNNEDIKKVVEILPFRNVKYNISPKKYLEYAKYPERAIKTFVKDEHFNPKKPERINIHNTNFRSNKVQVLDTDEYNECRWLTRKKTDINELLYDRGVNHLYVAKNILESNGIFLDKITQKRLDDKIKEYETDDKLKKEQISMISDLTYDYRDLVDLNKKQTKLQIKN
jgi:hypothetical protein